MHKQDYYQILEVDRNANKAKMEKAFIKLALQYHPQINPRRGNEGKFEEVYQAYSVLKDEGKKREYDRLGLDAFTQAHGEDETSLDSNFESILYEMLEVSKDASEQDIDKASTKLVNKYRNVVDLSGDNLGKLMRVYGAFKVLKEKAKRREYHQSAPDTSQENVQDEAFSTLSIEDILFELRELARKFGLDFDEKAVDPLGVLPLGKQVVNDTYWHAQHLLSDVLGIRIKGKTRGRRLL